MAGVPFNLLRTYPDPASAAWEHRARLRCFADRAGFVWPCTLASYAESDNMRRWTAIAIMVLIVAGTETGTAQTSPWPMFRHDLQHTGRTAYTGASGPVLRWTFSANDGIASSPSIGVDGTIYVGAGGYFGGYHDSSLYAIRQDGSLKWQFKTGKGSAHNSAGIFSSPAIGADGTIFVGGLDSYLYCLEDSGTFARLKWRRKLGNWPVYSSPATDVNGNVYVGGLDFNVYGIRPDSTLLWNYTTGWCVLSSPALTPSGTVVIGSKDHRLYAFSDDGTASPRVEWRYAAGTFYDGHLIDASPAIGTDGTIYFGTDPYGAQGIVPQPADTNMFAVRPNGTLKWKLAIPAGIESSPAIGHDGTIYVGCYDSSMYAVADSGGYGVVKWRLVTDGPVDASPTVDGDGTIYIGSRDSTLYAVNPNGSEKWRFETQGGIESSVSIDGNGYLYFGSFDGHLYCLGTGKPDVGVRSAYLPASVRPGLNCVPSATVANYRAAPRSFQAVCVINQGGAPVYDDTIAVVDLAGGSTYEADFASWHVGSDTSLTYQAVFTTILPQDDNTSNDSVLTSIPFGSCCAGGTVGNLDNSADGLVTMGDLTVLIDHLFISLSPLSCPAAGNLDLSPDGLVTLGDLTVLIDHLFISLAPLSVCP
jgi:outer membrane protein assembly factor BamB